MGIKYNNTINLGTILCGSSDNNLGLKSWIAKIIALINYRFLPL